MILFTHSNLEVAIKNVTQEFISNGSPVIAKSWQSIQRPEDMYEVQRISFSAMIPDSYKELQKQIKPNLPWAEDHFQERIGGKPLNPGEQYKNWPFYKNNKANDTFRTEQEKFSHTYMERIWPKKAHEFEGAGNLSGIRYEYGDFNDVITLLLKDPTTRQAYLPIWFPEDTGTSFKQRVPCSLGYLFTCRGSLLNVTYYIRSCDYLRHFKDDVYLACRKVQWLLTQLQGHDSGNWANIRPGIFTMHIESLHVFLREYNLLKSL